MPSPLKSAVASRSTLEPIPASPTRVKFVPLRLSQATVWDGPPATTTSFAPSPSTSATATACARPAESPEPLTAFGGRLKDTQPDSAAASATAAIPAAFDLTSGPPPHAATHRGHERAGPPAGFRTPGDHNRPARAGP